MRTHISPTFVQAASVPRDTIPRICDAIDDCCFNDAAGCENQGFGSDYCNGPTGSTKMCSNFLTTAGTVPSCDGADCCEISTGWGGSCDYSPEIAAPTATPTDGAR